MAQTELQEIPQMEGNQTLNQQFTSLVRPSNSSSSVQIEAQRAAVQVLAQVMVAQNNPRDISKIRQHLLEVSKNPLFAEKAIGIKPVGDGVEYKSVHMMKYIASKYQNFEWQSIEHTPINGVTQVEVHCWDIENNTRDRVVVSIEHVEKRNQKLVTLTDPKEYRQMVKARTSETVRNAIESIVGAELCNEVFEACRATLDKQEGDFKKSGAQAIEAFQKHLNVNGGQLAAFLHIKDIRPAPDGDLKPQHVRRLRALAQAVAEGEVNPADLFKGAINQPKKGSKPEKQEKQEVEPAAPQEAAPEPPKQEETVAEKPSNGENAGSGSAAPTSTEASPAEPAAPEPKQLKQEKKGIKF